tara:strand:+ start:44 stop:256 length:213 start_codon:yes stop_codon:yes gene_type:complete
MSIDPADYWMTPAEERRLEDKLTYGHQTTKSELDDYGNKIKVTRRKDGTTTIKSSGPCGRSDYDENGNLC